jgi:protein ImuB
MISLFRKDSRRILAVWFPYLGPERIWRQRLGRSWRSRVDQATPPMVLSHRDSNTQRIASLDARAEALKLKPGLGIADARARYPAIEIVEADPEADRRLLEALADWCDRYTPLVAIDGTEGLFLDITGCAHLFGGEEAMLDDLRFRLGEQGFDARVGLGSTPGAAWAAARYGLPPIGSGEEAAALSPLPLAALRIDYATRESLESVGLRAIGSIMSAPRAPLARRFGMELITRIDQALGRVEESITPRLPVAPLSAERHFPEPILLTEDIERLISMLAAGLKRDLERRGEGARRLQLALFRVDGAVSRIAVGTSRPLREPRLIARLFHERLAALEGSVDPGYGFDLVRLAVLVSAEFDDAQGDLTGRSSEADEDLALFADRLRARLGDDAVLVPVLVESHIPERAVELAPFAGDAATAKKASAAASGRIPVDRPIRLFRDPEPVEVTAEVPEGPPASFRWRRASHRVASAEGPERIAPEWWRVNKGSAARDYYRVEDEDGRRYWLFRDGAYDGSGVMPGWFMHGLFA